VILSKCLKDIKEFIKLWVQIHKKSFNVKAIIIIKKCQSNNKTVFILGADHVKKLMNRKTIKVQKPFFINLNFLAFSTK